MSKSNVAVNLRLVHTMQRRSDSIVDALSVFRKHRLTVAKMLDGSYGNRSQVVGKGLYSHLRRTEAIWNFLLLAGVPQTAAQIYEAIDRGNAKSTAEDPLAATYHSLHYGTENGRFIRLAGLGGENMRRTIAMWTIATPAS